MANYFKRTLTQMVGVCISIGQAGVAVSEHFQQNLSGTGDFSNFNELSFIEVTAGFTTVVLTGTEAALEPTGIVVSVTAVAGFQAELDDQDGIPDALAGPC